MSIPFEGVISNIQTREVNTKFGPKKTYSVEIGGSLNVSWGFKTPPAVGSMVAGTYKDDAYRSLESYKLTVPVFKDKLGLKEERPFNIEATPASSFPVHPLSHERVAIRKEALSHAVKCVTDINYSLGAPATSMTFMQVADTAIQFSRRFEAYICGDLDREQAMKELAEEAAAKDNPNA